MLEHLFSKIFGLLIQKKKKTYLVYNALFFILEPTHRERERETYRAEVICNFIIRYSSLLMYNLKKNKNWLNYHRNSTK